MSEPVALPPSPPSVRPAASRLFVVLVATITALAVIGSICGYDYWRANQPSMAGLGDKVLASMNESLAQDEDFSKAGLHVKHVSVMRGAGNMFEGAGTVATRREADHRVTVHIVYDGEYLDWHTDPGSFAFVAREQFSS